MTVIDDRADQHDITLVLHRYADSIDRRDWDLFRTCFIENVQADYDGLSPWSGVDEITDYMAAVHEGLGHTMHRLSNIVVNIDGDHATARTYVDAVLMSTDGSGGVNPVGYYDDHLVRTPDGWRIAHRRFTSVRFGVLEA